jgi:translocator protein
MTSLRSPLAVATAAVAVAAGLGTVAVDVSSAWYRRLEKPSWQPPAAAFGPVWTGLYASMVYAGARAWREAEPATRRTLVLVGGANLVLNAGWNVVFFRAHKPTAAVATIVALESTTLAFMAVARRNSPAAAAVLVPYAAWTGYASALNIAIARRN